MMKDATTSTSEKFHPDTLPRMVLNLDTTFHWIHDTDRFWFRRQRRSGEELVVVDAAAAREVLVLDLSTLREELIRASLPCSLRQPLVLSGLSFEADGSRLLIETPEALFACDVSTNACTLRARRPASDWVVSPDRSKAVLRRQDDLWLRDLSSGKEHRLTHDGAVDFGYGDINPAFDTRQVARRRAGEPTPLLGILWSPDSDFVVAVRQDLRPFPQRLYVTEYVSSDTEYVRPHFRRVPLARDSRAPDSHMVVIDTRTCAVRTVKLDPQALNDYALVHWVGGIVWWSSNPRQLFLLTANRGGSRYALCAVDLASGDVKEVIHESARFNVRLNPHDYSRPNVCVLPDTAEAIWYSERSGHGHLYLYDLMSGKLKQPITRGDWVIFDLLRVDEQRRIVYFTAASRVAGEDPYLRHLYRVSMDGGEPELLTPERADHKFTNPGATVRIGGSTPSVASGSSISPTGRYFVDSYSTTQQPPEYVLRRISGELVAKVLASDVSDLYATLWQPTERVTVKAADGVTDLYGVITRPRDFDPTRKYPVIDSMYPGPQGSVAPRAFADQLASRSIHQVQAFADAGFIVVTVDGRGTAYRSRAFRDAFLGTEDVFGASDHVAALRNLAAHRPYMDLERIGVIGQSFGGYGALRAMLLYPDFFKVGVSATAPGEWLDMVGQISVERFFGVPSASAESSQHYRDVSNTTLASRLKGKVLLLYGGIDQNVTLKHAFTVVDSFVKAEKDIDMLILPDGDHGVPREAYATRRSVQYFVEHLAQR